MEAKGSPFDVMRYIHNGVDNFPPDVKISHIVREWNDKWAYPKLVDPPGEARSDTEWINDLANRLGLKEHFWESEKGAFDELLKPSGLSWEDFKEKGPLRQKGA
jgi:hypothetical protein